MAIWVRWIKFYLELINSCCLCSGYICLGFSSLSTTASPSIAATGHRKHSYRYAVICRLELWLRDTFIPDTDTRYQVGIHLREYLPDICKCVNSSHLKYMEGKSDKLGLNGGRVERLGEIRLITAMILFETVKVDLYSQGESLNLIHDSTFHILSVWSMQKNHNSIYMVNYIQFLQSYCRKASNTSLINAFLKTNLLADISSFFMDNIYGTRYTMGEKSNISCYFTDIVAAIQSIKSRPECA